jgi:epoxyqueuosine reductase QueG
VGICVAVAFPKKTIFGIHDMPTLEYFHQYHALNDKLDEIVTYGADYLKKCRYNAIAKTRKVVDEGATDFETVLPHKTIATRAGLGWIGKCALLVTKEFGSMIRISSILTDAPLETAQPINASECGTCEACRNACPADAVSGKLWDVSMERERFWNAKACRETARRRSFEGFGREITLCGKCIEVCPYTRRYLNKAE